MHWPLNLMIDVNGEVTCLGFGELFPLEGIMFFLNIVLLTTWFPLTVYLE